MGIGYFDYWSIGHFSGGVLSQALIQTTGTSTALNLIIANSIHLFIELFEKDVKFGKLAESFENHMTDIIFFFLGWLLSYLTNSAQYIPRSFIPALWAILGLGMSNNASNSPRTPLAEKPILTAASIRPRILVPF